MLAGLPGTDSTNLPPDKCPDLPQDQGILNYIPVTQLSPTSNPGRSSSFLLLFFFLILNVVG